MNKGLPVPRPSLWQSLLEVRALAEAMSLLPAWPLLKMAPSGDGHPVLVLPGFFAADTSTANLRSYLDSKGFVACAWQQGRNPGISDALYQRLEQRVLQLSAAHRRTVSLVGWSLGGIYARLLAHRIPDRVRQVVTLGAPFKLSTYGAISRPVQQLYRQMNPARDDDPMLAWASVWCEPPPVPSTSIYSAGDGVAHWRVCVDEEGPLTENLQLPGSHLGMTHNPLMQYAVADRLAQPEGHWQPFRPKLALREMLARARTQGRRRAPAQRVQ